MPVGPAVSRAWTWTACGTIQPTAPDQEALFAADGSIAVLDVTVPHQAKGDPIEVVTLDLAGAEVSRVRLNFPSDPNEPVLLSPAGDRITYGGADGRLIWPQGPPAQALLCLGSELRVSPKGKWAAGASYGGTMDVFSLADAPAGTPWKAAAQFRDTRCYDVAAFSRDERTMVTSAPALYRTDANGTWQPVWSRFMGSPLSPAFSGLSDVHLTPDESAVLVSRCEDRPCVSKLYDVATGEVVRDLPELTDPRPSLSPEGSWIIAGGKLLHLPSGDTRPLDSKLNIATALFTSRGEIIAGTRDGALVRYCRAP